MKKKNWITLLIVILILFLFEVLLYYTQGILNPFELNR